MINKTITFLEHLFKGCPYEDIDWNLGEGPEGCRFEGKCRVCGKRHVTPPLG